MEIEVRGAPILVAICHCDDCQTAGALLEAREHAPRVLDDWQGTAYVMARRDRVRMMRGETLLEPVKLRQDSSTSRFVARCCNSPMFVGFDKGPFWISAYLDRFTAPLPVVMRVQTKYVGTAIALPISPPAHATAPIGFMTRLLGAGIAMALRI